MAVRISDPLPLSLFAGGARSELARLALPRGHMRGMLRRRPRAALAVVAIRDEARVVGWAAAELLGRRYLMSVYVHPRQRRQGVGERLLEAAWTAAARRWPHCRPVAQPWSPAGRALYRRAGFVPESEATR